MRCFGGIGYGFPDLSDDSYAVYILQMKAANPYLTVYGGCP